jgi:inhibitor of cysteine peptidase
MLVIVIDQNHAGQTVDLPIGQVMELRLAENPTTGYRWTFVHNGAPVCLVMSDQFERPTGPPGQGGEHAWQIKGAAVGECDIAMQYSRSFEQNAAAKSFALHVRVTQ